MELRFFEIYRSSEYVLLLIQGVANSLSLTILAGISGFVLATILAGMRYFKIPLLRQICTCFVEFTRNTPLIVQLFFFAFGLPILLGYQWPFWAHALLALTLNFSAYFSEILRAGFQSIEDGQKEAALSLGISPTVLFFKIIFPQAVSKTFPSLSSQFIFLFLTTGIISEIGVVDLTQAGIFIDSRTFRSFEVFITLTILYVFLSIFLKLLLSTLQKYFFSWRFVA